MLPEEVLFLKDCLVHQSDTEISGGLCHPKEILHVQGISHWAPASIGPCSQSIKLGEPCHIVGRVFWGFEGQHGYRKDKTRSALEDKDQKQLGELPLLSMDRANAEPGTSQDAKLSQLAHPLYLL